MASDDGICSALPQPLDAVHVVPLTSQSHGLHRQRNRSLASYTKQPPPPTDVACVCKGPNAAVLRPAYTTM